MWAPLITCLVFGSEGLTPCAEYKTRYSAEASETKRVPGGQLVSWGQPTHTGRRHAAQHWRTPAVDPLQ